TLAALETPAEVAVALFDVADLLWKWDAGFLSIKRSGEARYRQVLSVDTVDGLRQRFDGKDYEVPRSSFLSQVHGGNSKLVNREKPEEPQDLPAFGNKQRRSASLMFVPIHVGVVPVGLLSIQSYRSNAFDEHDLGLLKRISSMIAPVIDRM